MTGTGFGDRQAARRQLVMMAGTLVVVLVVINVIAIYGLDRIGREAESYAAVTERLIETTDLAREAQVGFKTQVQEWKNVLLRGHVAEDLARYTAAFHDQETAVAERLDRLHDRAARLGLATGSVERLIALHAELRDRYATALQSFDPADPQAAWRVDHSVRGMDRPLNDGFDAQVAEVRDLAAARRKAVEAAVAGLTRLHRQVLIGVHAGGIVLVLVWLVLALRALRRG